MRRRTGTTTLIVALAVLAAAVTWLRAFGLGAAAQEGGPGDAKQMALKKELLESARKVYELEMQRVRFGAGEVMRADDVYLWSRRWLEAQVDLAANKDKRVEAHREHLDRMKALDAKTKALVGAGKASPGEAAAATYYRTQAELWLEQAPAK
jgi:hypothetical protein